MRREITASLITVVLIASVAMLSGCVEKVMVGKLRTDSQSVELDGVESVNVEIDIWAGELGVSGGADKLLEANYTYNVDALKPEIEYSDGTLIVEQSGSHGISSWEPGDYRCGWDLRFNDDVPMDLNVNFGIVEGDLELSSLNLTSFEIDMGAGAVVIDLIGDWKNDLDADIAAGAGKLTLRLPSDVGTHLEVDVGAGTINAPDLTREGNVYTNDAYGKSDVTLSIDIEAGVGEINLELEGVSTKSKGGER